MRYADRSSAGLALAGRLSHLAGRPSMTVLALPRGGVPVAVPVAAALGRELDVLVIRKLGVPWQPELAMGAIGPDGVRVLVDEVVRRAGLTVEQIEEASQTGMQECHRQERLYRAGRPPLHLAGMHVVIVDDGLATGASMLAAVRVARAAGAARVTAAAPVGATSTIASLGREADDVVVDQAVEAFRAVGQWYSDFSQVTDAQVLAVLTAQRS